MHVQLKLVLDTDPSAAWRALRSPTVMRELYAPLLSVGTGGETLWSNKVDEVPLSFAGVLPLGRQLITLEYDESSYAGVTILRDTGGPSTGPLSALRGWNHRMAISRAPDSGKPGGRPAGQPGGQHEDSGLPEQPLRTLLRDRLTFHGPAAGAFWYPLWAIWQWRGARLRSMAPNWAFDPELRAD